jgi:hypothetical protein
MKLITNIINSILIGTLSILINTTSRSNIFRKNNDRDNQLSAILTLIGFILLIFAPLIAQLIQLAISRRREYFADASAVKLTRQPQSLINALKKNGFVVNAKEGNFIFVKPRKVDADIIVERMKQEKKILIKSYSEIGTLGKCLRVTTGEKIYMEKFLEALLDIDK